MREMNSAVYQEYISRVNSVQDYIGMNMDKPLSLRKLAGVAGFSEFHFHRIFSSIVNETLYKYINRLRLERAANLLLSNRKRIITEIALDCGFSESAVFSRSFKKHYGISAREYRLGYSRNHQPNSKNRKDGNVSPGYNESYDDIQCRVDTLIIKEMTVVYMRYTGPYRNNTRAYEKLYSNLIRWAGARDLLDPENFKLFSVYHDNPEITEENRQRTSVCLAVPDNTAVDGEVGKMIIPSGKYAVGRFEIHGSQFEAAWNSMYGRWLPSSGFQADDRVSFELYKNHPDEHPQKKSIVDIYLPIRPL